MNESSFAALAEEIAGLLGVDRARHASLSRDTIAVRGYAGVDQTTGSVSFPIYQSTTFAHPAFGKSTGFAYTRCGNPTTLELENTVALLEGGLKAFAFSSGMAAISNFLKLFQAGDHLLVSDDLYGGTYRLFNDIYGRYGLKTSFVDMTDLDAVRAAVKPNTKALFVETPTNPMQKVVDLDAVAQIAHDNGSVLAVDNTFLSFYFQKPLEHGADFVLYSGTKYLCGHNDVLCGFLVIRDDAHLPEVFNNYQSEGATLPPFEAWLMLRSLKTLSVRLDRQQENAFKVFEALKRSPHVTDVYYAGDPEREDQAISRKQSTGFGSIISFRVDSNERLLNVLEKVNLVLFAESLGGVESLITYPYVQTHGAIPEEMRRAAGVDDRLLRLSIGIENAEDLIADLEQALEF